jgi:hypothetical protein
MYSKIAQNKGPDKSQKTSNSATLGAGVQSAELPGSVTAPGVSATSHRDEVEQRKKRRYLFRRMKLSSSRLHEYVKTSPHLK